MARNEISHKGRIVSVTPESTIVEIVSTSACAACHAKGMCGLSESKIKTNEVQILTRVKIRNKKNGQTMSYMIVSESEANLKEGKLSVTTPIAKGLLGKKVGEIAEVQVPSGKLEFEILEISL